jgi:O-antigen/teichoic acid export membrane protein
MLTGCDTNASLCDDGPGVRLAGEGVGDKRRVLSAGRHFASGAALITGSNVFVRLLGLAALPVLTHLLNPSAYGIAALVTSAISLVTVFALAGADVSYIRASQDTAHDPKEVERLTWQFALFAASIASLLGFLCWLAFSASLELPRHDVVFVVMGIPFSVGSAMAVARARLHEQHIDIAIAIAVSGSSAVAISALAALSGRTDEAPLLLGLLASFFIPILVLGMPPLRTLLRSAKVDRRERWAVLGIGAAVILTAPAYWVMSSLDRWFLQYFEGASSVGVYSIAASVGLSGLAFNAAITTIWVPEATKLVANKADEALGSIATGVTVALAIAWLAVSAAGGDIIRLLAAPEFHAGAAVVPILAGGVFFHGMSHLANGLYVTEKRVHHTVVWWAGGMLVILILNFMLIPTMGMEGAALAQLLGFALVAVGMLAGAGARLLPYISKSRPVIVFAVILAVAPVMVPQWSGSPLASLALKFPTGLCVAAFAIWGLGQAQVLALWRVRRTNHIEG